MPITIPPLETLVITTMMEITKPLLSCKIDRPHSLQCLISLISLCHQLAIERNEKYLFNVKLDANYI